MFFSAFQTPAALKPGRANELPFSRRIQKHRACRPAAGLAGRAFLRRLALAPRRPFEIVPGNLRQRLAEGTQAALVHDAFTATIPAVDFMHGGILAPAETVRHGGIGRTKTASPRSRIHGPAGADGDKKGRGRNRSADQSRVRNDRSPSTTSSGRLPGTSRSRSRGERRSSRLSTA